MDFDVNVSENMNVLTSQVTRSSDAYITTRWWLPRSKGLPAGSTNQMLFFRSSQLLSTCRGALGFNVEPNIRLR